MKMKCSTCKIDLVPKEEDVKIDIEGCSVHDVRASYSECPNCNTQYSTPAQMLSFVTEFERIKEEEGSKKSSKPTLK